MRLKKEDDPGPAPAPRLPPAPVCFGREAEIERLASALEESFPPLAVLGAPGVGKATLALAALHDPRPARRFGARRFFVRCDGARSREALLVEIARGVGAEPSPKLAEGLLRELGRAPAALALAGLEVAWKAEAGAVQKLLQDLTALPGLALLITVDGEEAPRTADGQEPLRLAALAPAAAREVFLAVAGERFRRDPDLDPLLQAAGRLPLAVALLAHAAHGAPALSGLRQRWREEEARRSAQLRWPGARERLYQIDLPLETALASPRVTPAARRLLALLAELPDGLSPEDVRLLLPGEGGGAAAGLREAGLAFEEAGRLRVLWPVREAIRRHHPPLPEDLDRAVSLYLERGAAAEWIEEPGNVHSMLLLGLEGPDPEAAIRAALGLGDLLRSTGWVTGGPSELERARQVSEELGREDLAAACAALLGEIARSRAPGAAREGYEQALRHYRHAGDVEGEARCLRTLGELALARSDLEAALRRLLDALPLFHLVRDARGEAGCLRLLGETALEAGNAKEARRSQREALALYRRLRDPLGQAGSLRGMADAAQELADAETARRLYGEASALYRRAGDLQGEAHCLRGLGDLGLFAGDPGDARQGYEQALALYRRAGDRQGEANCRQRQGDLAMALSDPRTARRRYEEALEIYSELREAYSVGLARVRLAFLAREGEEERRRHLRAAREAWESIGRVDLVEAWLWRGFGEPDL